MGAQATRTHMVRQPLVMNVFRSLARDLWNVVGTKSPELGGKTLDAVRQRPVPAVLGLSRFSDGFQKFPAMRTLQPAEHARHVFARAALQRDGFDGGPRRSPVDLSGGVNRSASAAPVAQGATRGFSASLNELASLL